VPFASKTKDTELPKRFFQNTNLRFALKRLKSQCFKLIGGFLSADSILCLGGFILQGKYGLFLAGIE